MTNFTNEQLEAAKAVKSPEALIEKLKALTPEQRQRLDAVTSEQELDAFLSETGEDLIDEEKTAAWRYVRARQAKQDDGQTGKAELADEELDNVAGGHGGLCHDSMNREIVTLITECVHGRKLIDECSDNDLGGLSNCYYLTYEKGIWYCNYNIMPEDVRKKYK